MKILQPKLQQNLPLCESVVLKFKNDEALSGVLIESEVLGGLEIKQLNLSESLVTKTDFSHTKIGKFDVMDCEFRNCNFTASAFPSSSWHVISIDGARCSGMQITDSRLKNVTFKNSKLELMNFRFSKLESILFEDCVLNDVDFNNANLKNVEFINCTINNISFAAARMNDVDISQSTIETLKGAGNLKGAMISYDQLMQLAPQLAHESGIRVK